MAREEVQRMGRGGGTVVPREGRRGRGVAGSAPIAGEARGDDGIVHPAGGGEQRERDGGRRGASSGRAAPKGKRVRLSRRGKAHKPGRRTRHRPGWRKH